MNSKQYSALDMVKSNMEMWRECMCDFDAQYFPSDTLGKVKELCKDYDLDIYSVKEVFDYIEDPFYYDIDKDEIFNSECESESEC